jgi:hypothetical protein
MRLVRNCDAGSLTEERLSPNDEQGAANQPDPGATPLYAQSPANESSNDLPGIFIRWSALSHLLHHDFVVRQHHNPKTGELSFL